DARNCSAKRGGIAGRRQQDDLFMCSHSPASASQNGWSLARPSGGTAMRRASAIFLVIAGGLLPCSSSPALLAGRPGATQIFRLDSTGDLSLIGVTAHTVNYRGRKALELLEAPASNSQVQAVALLKGTDFTDGTIEVDLAGAPKAGAPDGARGFVGIAFRSEA